MVRGEVSMLLQRPIGLGVLAVLVVMLARLSLPAADDKGAADEEFLKSEKIGTTTPELIAFLRTHIPSTEERKRIEDLVGIGQHAIRRP